MDQSMWDIGNAIINEPLSKEILDNIKENE